MSGTVLELLERLHSQIESYALYANRPDPGWSQLNRPWATIAAAAEHAHRQLHLNTAPSKQLRILRRITRTSNSEHLPALEVHWRLSSVAVTLGALGDLLATAPVTGGVTRNAARQVAADLDNQIGHLASQTLRSKPTTSPADRLTSQLAALAYGHDPSAAFGHSHLHHWRQPRPNEPTVDGAAYSWVQAAQATLTPNAVTSLSMQLVAADIALLCAAAARLHHCPGSVAAQTARRAAHAWLQSSQWAEHLRLGGRTSELRGASRLLRTRVAAIVQAASPPNPAADAAAAMAAVGQASRLLTYAVQGGSAHDRCCTHLLAGEPALWIETRQLSENSLTVAEHLDGLAWRPKAAVVPIERKQIGSFPQAQLLLATARREMCLELEPGVEEGRRTAVAWEPVEVSPELRSAQRAVLLAGRRGHDTTPPSTLDFR